MDEAAALADELGFSEFVLPELDDIMVRLVEIRPDWDWKEVMNPELLSAGTPLSVTNEVYILSSSDCLRK